MEELRYKRLEEIKVDSKMLASVAFKPIKSPIVIGIVGIALLFINSIWMRILGVFFVGIAALVMFLVGDKKTIDIYEKGCIIYNPKNSELAYYLDFKDVEEWEVTHESGHDTVTFTLLDKNRALVETFQTNKIYAALEKACPEKNHITIMAERNKKANINPVDAIRNLVNNKKK